MLDAMNEEDYVPRIHPRKPIKESHPKLLNILGSDIDLDEWRIHGNCVGVDPEVFYPERGKPTKQAKEICSKCIVQKHCALEALENNEKHGIWGGLSERERRRIRRQRKEQRSKHDPAAFLEYFRSIS